MSDQAGANFELDNIYVRLGLVENINTLFSFLNLRDW